MTKTERNLFLGAIFKLSKDWKKIPYILIVVAGFASCQPTGKNIPEPNFNPQLLHTNRSVPAIGKAINMDSVQKPVIVPIKGKFVKAGIPTSASLESHYQPAGKPQITPARPKRVNMDSVALPKTHSAKGKKIQAGWPDWIPAQLGYKDKSILAYLDVEQGLSAPFIRCILEDRYGRIWIPQNDGTLSVWDGKGLTHYTQKDGLGGDWIQVMMEDHLGRIWIENRNGLMVWDGDTFTHYNASGGLIDNNVNALLEDRLGRVWVGTNGGVWIWAGSAVRKQLPANDSGFTQITTREGLSDNLVSTILEDRYGRIWIGTYEGGISVWEDSRNKEMSAVKGNFTHYTTKNGLISNRVYALMEDSKGRIWVGSDEGISIWDSAASNENLLSPESVFTHYTTQEGLSSNEVLSIMEDREGRIWLGTGIGGISVLEADREGFTYYNEEVGLSNNGIWDILEDRNGGIWIGTIGGGVNFLPAHSRLIGGDITHYSAAKGLSTKNVWALLEDRSGRIWTGTHLGGVSVWSISETGGSLVNYTSKEGLISGPIESLVEDSQGRIWMGSRGGGASVWDERLGGFTHYTTMEGLGSDVVLSILESRNGSIWLGSRNGVYVLQEKKGILIHFTTAQGLIDNGVKSMLEDHEGRIWIGTTAGVSVWHPKDGEAGIFINYTITEGLCQNYILSLAEDRQGRIWIGTVNGGVTVWTPGENGSSASFNYYTKADGLTNNSIRRVSSGLQDDVWIGTYRGLNWLRWQEKQHSWEVQKFFKPDGLSGISIYRLKVDQQGQLWMGTSSGLSRIDLTEMMADTSKPVVILRELQPFFETVDWRRIRDSLSIGHDPVASEQKISLAGVEFDSVLPYTNLPAVPVLPYDLNDLSFHWSGIQGSAPHQLQYSYILEGNDTDWSPLVRENSARFQNLSPGDYTFKVKAVGGNGRWSESAAYTLRIRPPWWQSTWAYLFYGLLLSIAVYSTHLFQRRRIVRKEKAKAQQKELEQARKIEKAYAQLKISQSQLIHSEKMASLGELTAGIAHEIQNPLNFVNNFSEVNKELIDELKEAQVKGHKDEIDAITKDILENEDKIMHHGKRAEAIVKSMLQHSRTSTGEKEPTDINVLADEYLRLAYHGFRAKDKTFNANFKTVFADDLPKINIVPQDIGRVLLNLINNAFQAVKGVDNSLVTISTIKTDGKVEISVKDNGPGIPDDIKDKIFQPFFTTKPTGEGTGLGLSLSYDIVTKGHGGKIEVNTNEEKGTEFIMIIPFQS